MIKNKLMKTGLIVIGAIIVIVIIFFISKRKPLIQVARQIKLDQLESVMDQLKAKKLEYDFFGITSNGVDCIYFVDNKGQINIEFEVMTDEQKPYVDQIKKFASDNGYRITETTYGNKPKYEDLSQAPVYRLETNFDTKTASEIGKKIMTSIFNCNETTMFYVVP
jgi:hypothetical protein